VGIIEELVEIWPNEVCDNYIALLGMVVISVLICVAIATGAQTRLV